MANENKAHTATANRIARRYGAEYNRGDGVDIHAEAFLIEVETTVTLRESVGRLAEMTGAVYVAVTNREAVTDAVRLVRNTRVGVMDPQGNIVHEATAAPDEP